jgi:hypothetical protein
MRLLGEVRIGRIGTAYLTYLYEHLPRAATVADLEALLPWNAKPLLMAARSQLVDTEHEHAV